MFVFAAYCTRRFIAVNYMNKKPVKAFKGNTATSFCRS